MSALFRWLALVASFSVFLIIPYAWAAPPFSPDEIATQQQQEFDKALKLYQESSVRDSKFNFSMYRMQEAAKKENPLALDWLRSEASKSSKGALIALGYYYGAKDDGINAVAQFKRAAQLGSDDAMSVLASIYSEGWYGVAKDQKASCEWSKRSAEAGNYVDAVEYGLCVGQPVPGIKRDWNEACRWSEVGAKGYENNLASIRDWTSKNQKENALFIKQQEAAASRAYALLAICLHGNPDTKSRITEAAKWYKASADLGNNVAAFLYGDLLEQGRGVTQDYVEAVRWYRASAVDGYAEAQNRLGAKYAEGKGVQKNMVEAIKWFMIAAANGDEKAVENRDKAEKSLAPAEVKKAQSLAAEWMKKNKPK